MTAKATRAAAKKKQPAAVETSESIAEQTQRFLEAGKAIEVVPTGVSGQNAGVVSKHITLGNKSA